MPLPPRRPAEFVPDATAKAASPPSQAQIPEKPPGPSACVETFKERGGVALPLASASSTGDCGIDDPVTFERIDMPDGSKVELDSAITVRCSFALEVLIWTRDDLSGIAARENAKLATLAGVGGHACRPRNGVAGAPISEHASGNALDVAALKMQDGRTIALAGRDEATLSMRSAISKSACARFTTVLGPGSDSAHKDHLHLDMRKRSRDFRICQWTVE
ncbi:hypothetical protein BHK69_24280 [Bosea vaviloviae]|uniref:Extensin-like C-terminal domain-containing protein n=2 Tax=Bosea vaviloviae TaxID=1526658 RepID=A0A1D7U729_9HYPH|nr:hypothetical protein BHK69_24280 [Bosea vaviloviae]